MEIREAGPRDVDELVELGRLMHAESPRFSRLPFDALKVEALANRLVENPEALVIVAEHDGRLVGMLAGVVAEFFFCHELYATDLVFYVTPAHRGSSAAPRMVYEWDRILREGGVRESVVGASTEVRADRVKALYERLGYRAVGAILVKDFSES